MPSERITLRLSVLILLLATVFSALALHHAQRWHPDEAFYMTFARNAAVKGDWLLVSEPVDKPPLTFYSNALALSFFAVDADEDGVLYLDVHKGEFAGRLPSLWMSALLVAVGMALAQTIYRNRRMTWLVGVLLALSPLRIAFAATAFTDLPMLLLATLSLWLAARDRWLWAGIGFILSIAAKPQSVFYLPLLLGMLVLSRFRRAITQPAEPSPHSVGLRSPLPSPHSVGGDCPPLAQRGELEGGENEELIPRIRFWHQRILYRQNLKKFLCFFIPIFIGVGTLLVWDVAREAQGAVNVWAIGRANYTPTQLAPLTAIPARWSELWDTLRHLFGDALVTLPLLGLGLFFGWRNGSFLRLLLLWIAGFVGLHLLITLNLFDRNLLVLLPPAVLLAAGGLAHLSRSRFMPLLLMVLMLPFAWQAATGHYELGGDRGLHNGIEELADYLNSKPVATVIYDRWLDWELDYYLGAWTNKRRVYYPTPQELVVGALALNERGTRYFVAPFTVDVSPWLDALREAGFSVQPEAEIGNFRTYSLQPPP